MMKKYTGKYQVVELTPWRIVWLNMLNLPRTSRPMFGLLEVDVTVARRFIAAYKQRTGETLSFTGYLASCLAQAVDENKEVQAYRKGSRQLVLFDDVDVGLLVERQVEGKRELTGYVVRGANHKSYRDIHQEIRKAQTEPVKSGASIPGWFRSVLLLPSPVAGAFIRFFGGLMRRDPTLPVSMQGTVGVTAVGMFGKGHTGYGLETTRHSLDLIVGSTSLKPAVVDGQILPRDILNLTVMFDHDVIDGAPAARFTRRLVELIESGYGLEQAFGAQG